MPDVGMPLPHSAPTSHTSTEQWQSFEIRMRHRRAERCVVRAEAALEAGLEDEARAALAEARALNLDAPDFETVSASVRARRAAALAAAQRARARRTGAIAVLAGTIATAAIALWIGSSGVNIGSTVADSGAGAPAPAHVAATTPAPPPIAQPPAASPEPHVQPDTVASAPAGTLNETTPESPVRTSGSTDRPGSDAGRPPTRPASEPTVPTPPASQAAGASAAESSLPPVGDVSSSIPLTRAPSTPADTNALGGTVPPSRGPDGLVKELPSAALPVVSAPPAPAPAPAAEPEAAAAEETRVRAVLARFEAAYSSLDASAARSVWPSVDARSLERAFNSLESQQVSLGRCSIVLGAASARAECSGSASWTPKVGGGRHTEARQWEFDLASRNGAWQIVRANAR